MKKVVSICILLLVASVCSYAQNVTQTFEDFLSSNFNAAMSALMILFSFLGSKIPALKNINKAYITIFVIVAIGVIFSITTGTAIKDIWISALVAIGTYLGILKEVINEPVIKKTDESPKLNRL